MQNSECEIQKGAGEIFRPCLGAIASAIILVPT
jgi:hypothetical protein